MEDRDRCELVRLSYLTELAAGLVIISMDRNIVLFRHAQLTGAIHCQSL
jgi:hypothetical protein